MKELVVSQRTLPRFVTFTVEQIARILEWASFVVVVVAMLGELAIMIGNATSRNLTGKEWLWSQEVGEFALVAIGFCGGPLAYRRGRQPALSFLSRRLPPRIDEMRQALVDQLVIVISLAIALYSSQAIRAAGFLHTQELNMSFKWYAWPVPIGMCLFAVFALARLVHHGIVAILAGGAFLAVFLGVEWAILSTSHQQLGHFGVVAATMAVTFALLLLIGVPIAIVFLGASALYVIGSGVLLAVMTTNLSTGVSNFILLAIPFFVLAGIIMSEAGLSSQIASFGETLVRRLPGGLLHVVVVTMYIFSGLSGSKSADMAAVGSALKTPMRKQGYGGGEIAAVLAASAIMGETIPPCLTLLILASVTSVSVAALFLGGILPAAVLGVLLMALIAGRARRKADHVAPEAASTGEIARSFFKAGPALAVPILLVGGIATGYASPTEVSAFAVLIAILLSIFYRTPPARYRDMANQSAVLSGMVLFFVAGAGALSWAITNAALPTEVAKLMLHFSSSRWAFMLVTIIVIPIMGLALEGIAAILIFAPILLPTAELLGINPVQYGLVLVIAMALGAFAPPIGWLMYEAAIICDTTPEATMRPLLLYYGVLVPGLVLIAFVPAISLLLPHLWMGYPLH